MANLQLRRVTIGQIRGLTDKETRIFPDSKYKYIVLEEYECVVIRDQRIHRIRVPKGFLTDGSSGGPDYGCSWLFHDWLYATHMLDDTSVCSRQEADAIMTIILEKCDHMSLYSWAFTKLAWMNPFYLFSSAWRKSGERGPQSIPLSANTRKHLEQGRHKVNQNFYMQRNCDIARYECAALRAYDARAFPLLPREIWAEILSLVMHRPDTGLLLFLISKPFYLLMTVMWKNRFPEWDFQLIPRAPPILKKRMLVLSPSQYFAFMATLECFFRLGSENFVTIVGGVMLLECREVTRMCCFHACVHVSGEFSSLEDQPKTFCLDRRLKSLKIPKSVYDDRSSPRKIFQSSCSLQLHWEKAEFPLVNLSYQTPGETHGSMTIAGTSCFFLGKNKIRELAKFYSRQTGCYQQHTLLTFQEEVVQFSYSTGRMVSFKNPYGTDVAFTNLYPSKPLSFIVERKLNLSYMILSANPSSSLHVQCSSPCGKISLLIDRIQ